MVNPIARGLIGRDMDANEIRGTLAFGTLFPAVVGGLAYGQYKSKEAEKEKQAQAQAHRDKVAEIIAKRNLLMEQRQAAQDFLCELQAQKKGMFEIIEKKVSVNKQVIDYTTEDRVVYWEKSVEDIEYEIGVVNEKYRIRVYEHKVYSGKWSRSATNKGFHMFLIGADYKDENRAIKSVKTMFNKIEAHIENAIDKKKSIDRAELAKEMALEQLKSDFPELDVKYEKEWHRSSYSKEGGYYQNRIVVTLENGKTFKFSYNVFKVNEIDTLKVDLDGWAGFDYVEVIRTISTLKQVK
jgi:hypothetical protein